MGYLDFADELYLDFSKFFAEYPFSGKVYLYLYQVVQPPRGFVPFLKVFLCRATADTNMVTFPTITVSPPPPAAAEEEFNDQFLDACIQEIATSVIKSHEIVANYKQYYRGFIPSAAAGDDIILVFENPTAAPDFMESVGISTPAILDEIMNQQSVFHFPVEKMVREMFYENPKLLYFTTEDGENFPIPQVIYHKTAIPERDAAGERGFFYYFDVAATAEYFRFAGQMDETVCILAAGEEEKHINEEFDAMGIMIGERVCYKRPSFFVAI